LFYYIETAYKWGQNLPNLSTLAPFNFSLLGVGSWPYQKVGKALEP